MSLIETVDLRKVYSNDGTETIALDNVSFFIEKGEFVSIMGPSGSGKSTLLHMLGFLERPTSGIYRFSGKTMDECDDDEIAHIRNKKMGFVFQSFNLLPRTTVYDNVMLPLLYSSVPESEWHDRVMMAIDSVELSHRLEHESSQLSGGEKQRVAIARALVLSPEVIFADEPTGNLDSKSGRIIMETLQKLNKEKEHTIILITHETNTARYAERIIKLRDGMIETDIKVADRLAAEDIPLK